MGPEKTALQGGGTPLNVCVPPLKHIHDYMPRSMSYAQFSTDFGGWGVLLWNMLFVMAHTKRDGQEKRRHV